MQTTPALGRPADRRMEIVRELRQQILDGVMPPGSQIPTRLEIETRYAVSPLTVQRALQQLREDGFITVNGRQGTYVATHPPHLSNFALVLPSEPNSHPWVRFWTALTAQASELPMPEQQQLKIFLNINRERDNKAFNVLCQEVEAHRLAGLIFASSPHLLANTPVLDEPGIPRVAIQSPGQLKPFPIVDLDGDTLVSRAFEYLKSQGRQRVAYIGPPSMLDRQADLMAHAAAHGLKTEPYWWQGVGPGKPAVARNCVHLLMNPNQTVRPDALLIADDNLVEHAMHGLMDAGIQVPDELEIVAHCNFGCEAPMFLPCRKLGFDSRRILTACIDLINAQRRGQEPPVVTLIPPVFDDELV